MENASINRVSYSQYKLWKTCPLAYKFKYVDKIADDRKSIHLVFGTACHDTIQSFLFVQYNKKSMPKEPTVNGIDIRPYIVWNKNSIIDFNMNEMLKDRLYSEVKLLSESERDESISLENMNEFYEDGVQIMDFLKRKRSDWFKLTTMKLVDIEFELLEPIKGKLNFVGFIDLLFRDVAGKYYVVDLKTSTRGWKDYQKKDKSLTNQSLLYKHYLSNKLKIPYEKIDVEYVILKRKIPKFAQYPAMRKRIQKFVPTNGSVSMKNAVNDFDNFIEQVFDDNGDRRTEGYEATPSKHACRFCEFKKRKICKFAI